ncbi:hypothetical protein [Gemmatimonas sp.]|uniref:hypothetical protein n=1 Tax=Gemmatimonas sp. TaxID=1962908 RepID=UPI003F713A3F
MPFQPQSQDWPGTRAVLLVHGIGDASTGADGAFPAQAIERALGDEAKNVAIYRLNYDFINDWLAKKVQFDAGIATLKKTMKVALGGSELDAVIAEYAGDVLWPVLSVELRLAVRDAIIAQLNQMKIDRGESALERRDDPLSYQISIVAHSLGCFHTYEVLHAMATEPTYELQPASDLFTFDSIVLMASPVKLIRTVAGKISALVPDKETLATLAKPLAIPAETQRSRTVPCTNDFFSVTGTHDPVGGYLLGKKLDWAYMDVPGQHSVIVSQQILDIDTEQATALALASAFSNGGPKVNDPHSWTAYIKTEAKLLRGLLLS